jgi:hypothetical protein
MDLQRRHADHAHLARHAHQARHPHPHPHHVTKRLPRPAAVPVPGPAVRSLPDFPTLVRRDAAASPTCSGSSCAKSPSSMTTTLPVVLGAVYV